jgi:phosphoribosylglycinamide formyltransferase-1
MKRLAILVSGRGSNMAAILDAERAGTIAGHVASVISNRADAPALAIAAARGVPTTVVDARHFRDGSPSSFEQALATAIDGLSPDLVVLAGFMRILRADLVARYEGRMLNIHPSLLPAFPGLHAIEQALAYGVKVFGVTVHFVDEGVDSGPVILQRAVELPAARSPDEVLRALRPLEHAMLAEAVRLHARGALSADPANPRRTLLSGRAPGPGEG